MLALDTVLMSHMSSAASPWTSLPSRNSVRYLAKSDVSAVLQAAADLAIFNSTSPGGPVDVRSAAMAGAAYDISTAEEGVMLPAGSPPRSEAVL